MCVFDSTWEASEAYGLDHNPDRCAVRASQVFGTLCMYRVTLRLEPPH